MKLIDALLMKSLPRPWRLVGLGFMGIIVGGGAFVADMSNAASYLSDDPRACINCHIMTPQYSTWQHSSHAQVASCNDCHVPQDSMLRKYWFKANDGARHSVMFTLRQEPQVIKARPESVEVIQANCLRCHNSLLETVNTAYQHTADRSCTDCHREVPHGSVHSLSSTPNAAVPPLSPVTPRWMKSLQESVEKRP